MISWEDCRKGIQTAMDDFGMGYSSLFELKNTPADIVKIDKGFVNGLTTDLSYSHIYPLNHRAMP